MTFSFDKRGAALTALDGAACDVGREPPLGGGVASTVPSATPIGQGTFGPLEIVELSHR